MGNKQTNKIMLKKKFLNLEDTSNSKFVMKIMKNGCEAPALGFL